MKEHRGSSVFSYRALSIGREGSPALAQTFSRSIAGRRPPEVLNDASMPKNKFSQLHPIIYLRGIIGTRGEVGDTVVDQIGKLKKGELGKTFCDWPARRLEPSRDLKTSFQTY